MAPLGRRLLVRVITTRPAAAAAVMGAEAITVVEAITTTLHMAAVAATTTAAPMAAVTPPIITLGTDEPGASAPVFPTLACQAESSSHEHIGRGASLVAATTTAAPMVAVTPPITTLGTDEPGVSAPVFPTLACQAESNSHKHIRRGASLLENAIQES